MRDIGAVAALVLNNVSLHINKSYELTCKEKLTFKQMAVALSKVLGIHINYKSPNLVSFFLAKRKEKFPAMLILVMIMLHYFPGFQKEPGITNCIQNLINRQPISFEQFIIDYRKLLIA